VTGHLPSDVRQLQTHEELVGEAEPPAALSSSRSLGAIIVPASRPAKNLDHAITLARAAQCTLVVLCSRQARMGEVNKLLTSRSFTDAAVIRLPRGYRHPWLDFATLRPAEIGLLPDDCTARGTDLSLKRNIGLILARLLGWDRVFFMDDDIRDVNPSDLRSTVSMLDTYCSVGMRVTNYPDNSVVCHAHRETGEFQGILVAGSALAVDCSGPTGFFPDIYNEDWLFFYDAVAERRLGCSDLSATQLTYDPFDNQLRAARQEFGDVIAEGLYALLHRGQGTSDASLYYWADFLAARKEFLDAIVARSGRAREEIRGKMLNSVAAAQQCLAQIRPDMCEHYVKFWRKDLSLWEQTLSEVPRVSSISDALSVLGLEMDGQGGHGDRWPGPVHADTQPITSPGAVAVPDVATLSDLPVDSAMLARLNAMAGDAARATLRQGTIPPGAVAAAAGLGQRLVAAGVPPLVLFVALSCVALTADLAPWRRRALGEFRPWHHRSLQKITAGRDATRILASLIKRRHRREIRAYD
jgi:hypothetical protein